MIAHKEVLWLFFFFTRRNGCWGRRHVRNGGNLVFMKDTDEFIDPAGGNDLMALRGFRWMFIKLALALLSSLSFVTRESWGSGIA